MAHPSLKTCYRIIILEIGHAKKKFNNGGSVILIDIDSHNSGGLSRNSDDSTNINMTTTMRRNIYLQNMQQSIKQQHKNRAYNMSSNASMRTYDNQSS